MRAIFEYLLSIFCMVLAWFHHGDTSLLYLILGSVVLLHAEAESKS